MDCEAAGILTPEDNGGSSDSGISGGWIFIIIVVVSVFVYVVSGCIYKRHKKGTTGMKESCPNVDFWSDVPSLAKGGCLFTYRKLKGCCGKTSDDTYNEM